MVFRTAGAIAALLTGLGLSGGSASAQYYPPAPPPQAYPPAQGYPAYRPLPPVADADDNQIYDLQGRPLPPAAVEPVAPAPRYGHGVPAYPDQATLPPPQGYREQQAPQGYGAPNPSYASPPAGVQAQPDGVAAAADQPRPDRRRTRRSERDRRHGSVSRRGTAGNRPEETIAAAVPSHAGRLLHEGAGRHDHHRHAEHLSLSGSRPG